MVERQHSYFSLRIIFIGGNHGAVPKHSALVAYLQISSSLKAAKAPLLCNPVLPFFPSSSDSLLILMSSSRRCWLGETIKHIFPPSEL